MFFWGHERSFPQKNYYTKVGENAKIYLNYLNIYFTSESPLNWFARHTLGNILFRKMLRTLTDDVVLYQPVHIVGFTLRNKSFLRFLGKL